MKKTKKHTVVKLLLVFGSFVFSALFWVSASLIIENFPLPVIYFVLLGCALFVFLTLVLSFSSLTSYLLYNRYLQLLLSILLVCPVILLINQTLIFVPVLVVSALLVYYAIKKTHTKSYLFTRLDVDEIFEEYFQQVFLVFITLLSLGLGLYSIAFTPRRIILPRYVTNKLVEDFFVNLGMEEKILLLDEEEFKKETRSILEASEDLTEEEKEELLKKESKLMDELVKRRDIPGVSADGIRLLIEQQINNIVQPFLKYIPLLLGILLWILLRFLAAPLVLLAGFGAEILIKVLVNLGILQLKKESVEAERLGF